MVLLQIKRENTCVCMRARRTGIEWRNWREDAILSEKTCFALLVVHPCVSNAKFCHICGKAVIANIAESEVSVSSVNVGGRVRPAACSTSSKISSTSSLTFDQFRVRKEEDRSKHFKKKGAKKLKIDNKANVRAEVKINIGIMMKKDDELFIRRGATLPLKVPEDITGDDLLGKAVEKHQHFNKDMIKHGNKEFYYLLFGDKSKANTIPGYNEPFILKRYKEEIDKPYCRITLYLCPCTDYMDTYWNDFDFDSDNDESTHDASKSLITTYTVAVPDHKESVACKPDTCTPVPCVLLDEEESEPKESVTLGKGSQCPNCFLQFPVQQIEEHAANCSLWLVECEQSLDMIEGCV